MFQQHLVNKHHHIKHHQKHHHDNKRLKFQLKNTQITILEINFQLIFLNISSSSQFICRSNFNDFSIEAQTKAQTKLY